LRVIFVLIFFFFLNFSWCVNQHWM